MQPPRNIFDFLLIVFAVGLNVIANSQEEMGIDMKHLFTNTNELKKKEAEIAERLFSSNNYFVIPSQTNLNQESSASKTLAPNTAITSTFPIPIVPSIATTTNDFRKIKPQKINNSHRPSLKMPDFSLTTPVPWALAKNFKFYYDFDRSTGYLQPVRSLESIPTIGQRVAITQTLSELPIKKISPSKNQKFVLPETSKAVPHAFKSSFGQSTIKPSQPSAETRISRSNSSLGTKIHPYNSNENISVGKKFYAITNQKHEPTPNGIDEKCQTNTIKPLIPTLGILEFDSKVVSATAFEKSIIPSAVGIFNYNYPGKKVATYREKPPHEKQTNNTGSDSAKQKATVYSDDHEFVGPRLKVPQENEIRLVVNLTPYKTGPPLATHLPTLKYTVNKSFKNTGDNTNKPMIHGFLSILKETNRLPKNLTPENIESGVKTLAFILEKLQKEKQTENIQTAFTPIVSVVGNGQNTLLTGTNRELETYPQVSGSSTPGRPGIDYPIYSSIPQTKFDCSAQRYKGFFGDPETKCQVWHYCDLNGGQASFLCPNGTIFSQVALTCDWWFNVKCASTSQLYVLNERLYKYILPFSPSFPEDYSGPVVDRYLTAKFKEMERKSKIKALNLASAITPTPSSETHLKS